jgi:hypothetical protein
MATMRPISRRAAHRRARPRNAHSRHLRIVAHDAEAPHFAGEGPKTPIL